MLGEIFANLQGYCSKKIEIGGEKLSICKNKKRAVLKVKFVFVKFRARCNDSYSNFIKYL
jgi:hypothetical protein